MAYGAIGGSVAGFVMTPFLMASAAAIGIPANSIFVAYGLALGAQLDNAMTVGISLHLLASMLIGVIFGSITSIVDRLRITGIGKAIAEGLVTGVIAFAVLFIPFGMLVLPPFLAQIIVVETELVIQQQGRAIDIILQQVMPTLIGLSIADHLIYGAVLGTVMSALVVSVRKIRGREEGHVDDNMSVGRGEHLKSEPQHICPECKRQFVTVQELDEHRLIVHYSGAAA